MPHRSQDKPPEGQSERPKRKEMPERPVAIHSRAEAEAYRSWKQDVPSEVRGIVESAMMGKSSAVKETGLPRVDAFLGALEKTMNDPSAPLPPDTDPNLAAFFADLASVETTEGKGDALSMLRSHDVPFDVKRSLWQHRLAPMLEYLAAQDLAPPEETKQPQEEESAEEGGPSEDGEKGEQQSDDSDLPPPDSDEMDPSMDEMSKEKEKGEPKAYFSVAPFYGGYFRDRLYSEWDSERMTWRASKAKDGELPARKLETLSSRLLTGKTRGRQRTALPLPYGWSIDRASLETDAPPDSITFTEDENGNPHLLIDTDGVFSYSLTIGRSAEVRHPKDPDVGDSEAEAKLPDELSAKIKEIIGLKFSSAACARMIVKIVREHLIYSNESAMNAVYRAKPKAYFERIWQEKKADCDVANTVAAAALREAGIACRLAAGHYVKSPSPGGKALMTSGTGHAWLEVYDTETRRWFRADATPKGDPTLDEERPDEQPQEQGEGDYGEKEAEIMSDEELEKLIESLEGEDGQEQSKSNQEREAEAFAREAGTTPEEARRVLATFERVREMKDKDGNRFQQKLIDAWKRLVQSRKAEHKQYEGPVRMSEGDELVEPAMAVIDIASGQKDPSGFEKIERREKQLKLFGGIDAYLAVDLSGSMSETDPVSGQVKAELQRDAAMLYIDSLMQCAFLSRQAQGRLGVPLPVRVQLASFHGGVSIDLPLVGEWGPKEQLAVYNALVRTAGGGTPDHLALEAIERKINEEREARKTKKMKPGEEPPVEFVAAFLDGGSDNASAVKSVLRRLREAGTVVYGYGMTAAAKPIKAAYAPDARVIETLSDLAPSVAEDTLAVFERLHPKRVARGKAKK